MDNRRVCMIVLSLYPNDERVRREAQAIEKVGYRLDIICQKNGERDVRERIGNAMVYRVQETQNKETIFRYLYISAIFMMRAFVLLQQLYHYHRHAIIHIHNMPDYLVFVAMIQKIIGVPIILDLHDLSVELYKSKWEANGKHNALIVKTTEKLSCDLADLIITTSIGFKERIKERGIKDNKINIVLNTPDKSYFKYAPQNKVAVKRLELLYHGTVAKRFGLTTAIMAMALLVEKMKDIRLYVYGKYDDRYLEELVNTIKKRKIEENIILGGWLRPAEINEVIKRCDIGLVPYTRNEFMNLAMSTKTFEYAATGLPIVASRLDSIRMIFDEDCVCYCSPDDPEDMAEKILKLALDPELKEKQIQKAYRAIEKIDGSVMERRYVHIVEKLSKC